jgi:hypothetical protein
MSSDTGIGSGGGQPAAQVGVLDAIGLGWKTVTGDLSGFWVPIFVAMLVQTGVGFIGAIPCVGVLVSLAATFCVTPQIQAGMFFAMRQRIDGAPRDVGNIFEGFRTRFGQSLVSMLPMYLLTFVGFIVAFGTVFATVGLSALARSSVGERGDAGAVVAMVVVLVPLVLAMFCCGLLFYFAALAVWDHPESGWAAAMTSARIVSRHFFGMLGFALMSLLIGLGGMIAGTIALCVGLIFTVPFVMAWMMTSAVYLYRSWSGQPLVQPVGSPAGPPVEPPPAAWSQPPNDPPTDAPPPPPADTPPLS